MSALRLDQVGTLAELLGLRQFDGVRGHDPTQNRITMRASVMACRAVIAHFRRKLAESGILSGDPGRRRECSVFVDEEAEPTGDARPFDERRHYLVSPATRLIVVAMMSVPNV